ncbi:MAG: glycosyl hydrolase family 8 [Lachnospiraceae bacterium]|nr:glycosyl hydrolase family 8 [Lachnospiraceae bacterium]
MAERNVFAEIGIPEEKINVRLEEIKQQFFYGEDSFYHAVGDDMGYLEDTGNFDARTEGMSYGMMICVQLGMKEEFDRIWKWAKTYMYMEEGWNEGYFAWSCKPDGTKNAHGAAPDGEEFFIMALLFASHRFGDGEGIYNYSAEAKKILEAVLHKGENGRAGDPMFNPDNKYVLFVPGSDFSDPSYHLPHFYELWAEWGNEKDKEFWKDAAKRSREYLIKACHPVTGFSSEYAEFDGLPMNRTLDWAKERHNWFFSDAYRTAANIGLDYLWFGKDEGQCVAAKNIQRALLEDMRNDTYHIYEIDGTVAGDVARHPVAITATVAQSVLASELDEIAVEWVKKFFEMPLRTGERRYYDNCLYMFAYLALSGNYKIW